MTIAVRDDTTVAADIVSARHVLDAEASALEALSQSLGDPFVAAVQALASVAGRVVVSGMGKSGHIARKIAATMASTGTPAYFVHPGEASHGDLGMIMPDDAVVALSNSGETSELGDIVAYTRRFEIPLVAITSRAGSTLAQAADVALILPPVPEACPMGLAPTTSTTLMLALGDALAVALLERKGFTAADFKLFHPGGKLGQRLLKAADLMHGDESMPVVAPTAAMSDVLLEMTSKRMGCAGVVDQDRLVGIITDGDLRRHMHSDLLAHTAADIMTANPKTVSPNTLAAEVLRVMNAKAITSLFVVDDMGRPLGVLHVHDLLRSGVA